MSEGAGKTLVVGLVEARTPGLVLFEELSRTVLELEKICAVEHTLPKRFSLSHPFLVQ